MVTIRTFKGQFVCHMKEAEVVHNTWLEKRFNNEEDFSIGGSTIWATDKKGNDYFYDSEFFVIDDPKQIEDKDEA